MTRRFTVVLVAIQKIRQIEDTQTLDVENLSQVEKLLEAVEAAAKHLPGEVAEEIQAIFTLATLATMVGVFAVYIAAHATGIGQAFDIGMLIAGGIFFGLDAFTIFKDIAGFAGAVNATTEEELEEAGEHLASAVAKIGVDALMSLLTKKVADEIGKTADHVNQVDEVTSSSDDLTPNRVDDVDAGNLDNAEEIYASQIDDIDNTSSGNSKGLDIEEPETTSSNQVDEITSSSDRLTKMSSAAKTGVESSDYSIKVGTVRMKEHPNYQSLISEVESKGYKIVEGGEARVSYVEIIDKNKEVIRVEKELHVLPDMR